MASKISNFISPSEGRNESGLRKVISYLGQGKNANLYYIDGDRHAWKLPIKNDINNTLIENLQTARKNVGNPVRVEMNEHTNKLITAHVDVSKVEHSRRTWKQIFSTIGLGIGITSLAVGIGAALPYIAIPSAVIAGIAAAGYAVGVITPFVGKSVKNFFKSNQRNNKSQSQQNNEVNNTSIQRIIFPGEKTDKGIKPLRMQGPQKQDFNPLKFADARNNKIKISLLEQKHQMNLGIKKYPNPFRKYQQNQTEKNKQENRLVESNIENRNNVGKGSGFK